MDAIFSQHGRKISMDEIERDGRIDGRFASYVDHFIERKSCGLSVSIILQQFSVDYNWDRQQLQTALEQTCWSSFFSALSTTIDTTREGLVWSANADNHDEVFRSLSNTRYWLEGCDLLRPLVATMATDCPLQRIRTNS